MTKAEILKALEPYSDDQYVSVLMYDKASDDWRYQMIIQRIEEYPPWYGNGEKVLVGICIGEQNRELPAQKNGND